MSDYPKVEVPESCCKSANKDLEKIKECIRQIRWSDAEFQYDEVIAAAERMVAEIEKAYIAVRLNVEDKERGAIKIERLEHEIARLKAELEKRPQVIFCKDCKKWHTENCSRRHWDHNYIEYFYPESDGYCEHGQRGESEGNG